MQQNAEFRRQQPECGAVEQSAAHDLITNALSDGSSHAAELHRFALVSAGLFRSGDERRALGQYIDLLTGFDWLVKALDCTGTALGVDFAATPFGGITLARFADDMNALLTEAMKAQERKDWVLLADLIEYELAPHLAEWPKVFALLKERVPSA